MPVLISYCAEEMTGTETRRNCQKALELKSKICYTEVTKTKEEEYDTRLVRKDS